MTRKEIPIFSFFLNCFVLGVCCGLCFAYYVKNDITRSQIASEQITETLETMVGTIVDVLAVPDEESSEDWHVVNIVFSDGRIRIVETNLPLASIPMGQKVQLDLVPARLRTIHQLEEPSS